MSIDSTHVTHDAIIIGGGFFGSSLAIHLKTQGYRAVVLEMEPDLLQHASYANQARVHNGYHYPRSILTASRSRINFPRFIKDYPECIYQDFDKYYAVGRHFSKVSARQFYTYFERIGSEIAVASDQRVRKLFNFDYIEEVFRVREYAFDAVKLKEIVWDDLQRHKVEVHLNTKVVRLSPSAGDRIEVVTQSTGGGGLSASLTARKVYNCTYSHINQVLGDSRLPLLPFKHEVTEMALVEVPDPLKQLGITVMCGPFFSFMPFPPRQGLHTLSHVRYTPHYYWQDQPGGAYIDTYEHLNSIPKHSNYIYMLRDVQRYIPAIADSRYVDSIWEVKTVLPRSEVDDSRPILMRKHYGIPNLTCIMGGKIDNIYDMIDEIDLPEKESEETHAHI